MNFGSSTPCAARVESQVTVGAGAIQTSTKNDRLKNIEDLGEVRASMSIAIRHPRTGVPLRAERE
jgi:hypothetical protein